MFFKAFLSTLAVILTFAAFVPYIHSIVYKNTKPHVFSWIIWASTTFIVFLAQLAGRGGIGAWPIGISGVITFAIAILAYAKRGDNSVTKTDWVFFLLAMSSLPLWWFTSDPLWAVVVLTGVDVLGFGPTFRKAYTQPHQEHLPLFVIMIVRNLLVIMALEYHSWTTVLFPAAIALASLILVLVIVWRRRTRNTFSTEKSTENSIENSA